MPEIGSENRHFRRADDRLVLALASGSSIREAARRCRVSQATVHRRLSESDFVQRLREVRSEMMSRAVGKLASALAAAATTLRRLLRAQSETVRLGAARACLEMHARCTETVALAERVAELERRLAARDVPTSRRVG